jgi:hypothetical protein
MIEGEKWSLRMNEGIWMLTSPAGVREAAANKQFKGMGM